MNILVDHFKQEWKYKIKGCKTRMGEYKRSNVIGINYFTKY